MDGQYEGKVAIVTGSGSGIGAATARLLHERGASVVLFGRREAKLQEVAAPLGERALVVAGDISVEAVVKQLVAQTVERFGRLDLLVNNAGVAEVGPFLEMTAAKWTRLMAIDVEGVFYATQAALPHLLATRGSVVNVSSVSGIGGDWGMSAYNAAKGAVSNLTRSLALEFGGRGVRVNAVAPSFTLTEMTAGMAQNEALLGKFAARLPIGRGATPKEVASVIAFLGSNDAVFVNGVVLPVDGGLSASNGQPNMGFAGTD